MASRPRIGKVCRRVHALRMPRVVRSRELLTRDGARVINFALAASSIFRQNYGSKVQCENPRAPGVDKRRW